MTVNKNYDLDDNDDDDDDGDDTDVNIVFAFVVSNMMNLSNCFLKECDFHLFCLFILLTLHFIKLMFSKKKQTYAFKQDDAVCVEKVFALLS
jgi:hypothetical protein